MKAITLLFVLGLMMTQMINGQTPPLEPGVSNTLARWRAAHYSDVRYKLNITLEKGAPLIRGTIEVSVILTDTGKQNDLILDWRTTQFANDKDKPFADVVAVNSTLIKDSAQNGVFDYQTLKEHLIVSKKFLKTGENTIKIKFASPIKTSGAAITRYVDKEDGAEYLYSLFVPSDASTAFPVFDQPDLKAKFQLNVIAPKDWKVVSNTSKSVEVLPAFKEQAEKFKIEKQNREAELEKRGVASFEFEETKPISTYVFAFAAGNFEVFFETSYIKSNVIEMPVETPTDRLSSGNHIYVRKSQAEKFKQHSAEVFRLNREGVRFLESYFDYKFPFPKYDLVLIPEFPFGGMEHAGATFLRESSVIFPTEPTKNDYVSRANVIFHEAAHQWFGDTVTMKWFDDLWLKEGFAEFMAYKTLEKVMPEYNAWKIFYERNKQAAYLTDSTKGTTPIYQEIPNLSAAKSAYGNIVYRKAPSFLKQAEFYLGEKEFQIAVRAFLKKHEFANAEWTDLVREFETASKQDLKDWANVWVTKRGMPKFFLPVNAAPELISQSNIVIFQRSVLQETGNFREIKLWREKTKVLIILNDGSTKTVEINHNDKFTGTVVALNTEYKFVFPNYQDYGYGIFLLDERSRAYVLANIQTEKDDFLRAMMWGSLWDSVREAELAPRDYVELVIKNLNVETDESTIQTLLGRVSTAMNYYIASSPAKDLTQMQKNINAVKNNDYVNQSDWNPDYKPHADANNDELRARIENLLIEKMRTAPTVGQRITFYRAFLNVAASEKARNILKDLLKQSVSSPTVKEGLNANSNSNKQEKPALTLGLPTLRTKDKFDIATRLLIVGDADAAKLLADVQKTETSDEAKRYAYAARAGIATAQNKAQFWNDFVSNKEISESWIEAGFSPFNSVRHSDLTLPYLEKALAELPNLKKNRKIFFVNSWLSAFIGGQKSEEALKIVNKFLESNPNLDRDLRLKILENVDGLERAVKIRAKYGKN